MLICDLFETVRPAYLFHGTAADAAANIIVENHILPHTSHYYNKLGVARDNRSNSDEIVGVSLTRSFKFSTNWGKVVFVLDQTKLRQLYALRPYDYFTVSKRSDNRSPKARQEAEEFLISRNGITDLNRYLVEIVIDKTTYSECVEYNDEYTNPEKDSLFYPLTSHPLLRILK